MRFSIIIPAFNSASSIRPCLESVLAQEFKDFEVLVMDGGSTDGTQAIVKKISAANASLKLFSEKDSGIYDAINKGIRVAQGEWIYVLGSDDRLAGPQVLASVSDYLSQTDAEFIYGNVKIKGDAGWAKDGDIHDGEFNLEKLLIRNICQQAIFYRRSLFQRLGYFNTNYPVCADWDFALHCAATVRMKYADLIIAEFNGGGTSKVKPETRFYSEFAQNMFSYFGWRILKKEFKVIAFRFKKHAEAEKKKGKRLSSFFYSRVYKRLDRYQAE